MQDISSTVIDHSCVLKGAASCLYYLSYHRIAFNLCNDLTGGNKHNNGFESFKKILDPKNLERKEKHAFQFRHVKS